MNFDKFTSLDQVEEWNNKWRFHSRVQFKENQVPLYSEWFYPWFFDCALMDTNLAIKSFFVISEHLSISRNISVEEGYGILLVNLDAWYFRLGKQALEKKFKKFKSNLCLSNPGSYL